MLRVFTSCESRRGSWNGRGYTTNHAHHSLCNSSHLATSRMSDLAVYLKSVDEQYKAGQWRENLENLDSYVESHKEALEEPEILWRIVRIYYKIGKYLPRDQKESEELSRKGYEYSEKSLKIDDKNFSCRKVQLHVGCFFLFHLRPHNYIFYPVLPPGHYSSGLVSFSTSIAIMLDRK